MITRATYAPGAATGAETRPDSDTWTLILHRDLRHSPAKVWEALTDPAQLREWAPFDADRNLGTTGPVTLSTVATPTPQISSTRVTRAVAPRVLEYMWGENAMRWELEPTGDGTRLTLWHNIGRRYVAMGAAGWHICLDVMDHFLADAPLGRIVGSEAMKFEWQRLNIEYSRMFGVDAANPPTKS